MPFYKSVPPGAAGLKLIAILSLLFSYLIIFSAHAATPPSVGTFSASKYRLNHGDSVSLRWSKPSGYGESVKYNIYVTKNSEAQFRWKSGLTSTSISRGGSTGILRSGTQRFDIEACNSGGSCGPRKTVSITIGGPPPIPNSFGVNNSSITQGQTISLNWSMHHNYPRATRYNLHVKKPGYSSFIFARNISQTQFSRTINLPGTHTFYLEPCDASNGCGPRRSLSVSVRAMAVPGKAVVPVVQYATRPVNQAQIISWSSVANASSYRLYENNVQIYSGSGRSTSRAQSTTGYKLYTVAACNLGGCGSKSSAVGVQYYAKPGVVTTFAVDKSQINHGDSIVLNWSKPAGYTDVLTYNLYVIKPDHPRFLWRSKHTTTTTTRGGDTGIQRTGTQVIEVEACHPLGGCGPLKSVSITVGGPPPAPWTFAVDKPVIKQGETIKLDWSLHHNYTRSASYNLSVEKPDGSVRYTFASNLSATTFNRLINMAGVHTFYAQACDSSDGCGATTSLKVTVNAIPVPARALVPRPQTLSQPINQSLTINWSTVATATSYRLYENGSQIYSGSALSSSRTQTAIGSKSYTVAACNVGGCGQQSPAVTVTYHDKPAAVASFTVDKSQINHGDSIVLNWSKPSGYTDALHYNLYVIKPEFPRFLWRSKLTTTTDTRGGDTGIQRSGTQVIEIEACNSKDQCGPLKSVSVTVGGPPPAPWTFTADKPSINAGETVKLSWAMHQNYLHTPTYNLSVEKPDGSVRYTFGPKLSTTEFNRLINMPGKHTFFVQACDAQNVCGATNSLVVNVGGAIPAVSLVDINNLDVEKGSYQVSWTSTSPVNSTPATFELVEEKNGVWGSPQTITNSTVKNVTGAAAGRYRYKVRTCEGATCSDYKTSAAFTLSAFNKSAAVIDTASLAGLSGDVGFTAGQFRVSESGAATYSVPLNLPAGVAGVKPEISLNYSSQGGESTMGRGWSLGAGGAVSRCPANIYHNGEIGPVQYDDTDLFCLNGQQLVVNSGDYGADGSTYHTAIDNFATVTAHGAATDSGPKYFTVATKSGDTYYYGQISDDEDDAFVEPNKPGGANDLAKYWALKKVVDVSGNAIRYHYLEDTEAGSHTLSSIEYGKNENVSASRYFNQVRFNYIDNPKPKVGYSGGSTISMTQLLDSVSITVDNQSYRHYDLNYFATDVIEERNYLDSLTECLAEGSHCLAPLSFTWQRPAAVTSSTTPVRECEPMGNGELQCFEYNQTTTTNFKPFANATRLTTDSDGRQYARMMDINADGYSDIIFEDGGWKVQYGPSFTNTPVLLSAIGSDNGDRDYALTIDYDGDGKQEMLVANGKTSNWHVLTYNPRTVQANVCYGYYNHECELRSYDLTYETVDLNRVAIGFEGAAQVMDVDGDGLQDIVFKADGQIQMYRNNGSGDFSTQTPLTSLNSGDALTFSYRHVRNSPTMKNAATIDINGDGRSDLLTKVTTTTATCTIFGGTRVDVGSAGECRDMQGTWNSSTNTSWKLYVSDGTMAAPRLTERHTINYSGDDLRVTDLNGDGLTDVVYRENSNDTWYYRLSNGYGFIGSHKTTHTSPDDAVGDIFFIDLNGDGRADILKPTSKTNWSILMSRPSTSSDMIVWQYRGSLTRDTDDSILFGDTNGDGKLDLVTTDDSNGWFVKYADRKNIVDNVITEFNNGWDVKTTVTYDTMLSDAVTITDAAGDLIVGDEIADTMAPIGPMTVVRKVEGDSNIGSRVSVDYRYGGLLLHRKGLGSLGFKLLKTTDGQTSNGQTGVSTTTTYSQSYPYIGMPLTTARLAADGTTILSSATNTLDQHLTRGNKSTFSYIRGSAQTDYQIASNGSHHTMATNKTLSTYDDWGNLTHSITTVQDDQTVLHTTATINSYGNVGSYEEKMGRLLSSEITKTLAADPGGKTTRRSTFSYYSNGESCDNVSQSQGMLKTSTVNGLTTTTCYNVFGHQVKVTKAGLLNDKDTTVTAISSSSSYSSDGRVINATTDDLGFGNSYRYNGNTATGTVTGLITSSSVLDANNVTTKQYFDGWGKVLALESATSATKTSKTALCTSCIVNGKYYIEERQSGTPIKQVIFDQFGREIATRVQHFNANSYSTVFKDYDSQGRLLKSYLPTLSSTRGVAASAYTKYNYDRYSRVTSVELPKVADADYSHPTTTFAGLITTKYDAKGHASIETRNLLGQLISVEDAKGGILKYSYNAFGDINRVTKVADASSIIQIDNGYNDYGQKHHTIDIDKGRWDYRYNAFGQLVWKQDGNNVTTTTVYDSAGRKSRRYAFDFTQCWLYGGDSDTNAKGKPIETRYYDGIGNKACNDADFSQRNTVAYDNAGRPYHTTEQLQNLMSPLDGKYHRFSEFDNDGRLFKQFYPGLGLTIRHEYNQNGYAYKLVNDRTNRVYQHITEMNANGQTKGVTYANGATEVIDYENQSERVASHHLTQGGTTLHSLAYEYDANDNLAARSHGFSALSNNADYREAYGYDSLNRLTDRTVTRTSDTAAGFSMNEAYRYDGFGNFISKSGSGHYKYNSNKRLTGIYDNAGSTGSPLYDFSYDGNGNIDGDGHRVMHYASFDKPTLINQGSDTTSFIYGIAHKRFYRHDQRTVDGKVVNTHTAYLAGIEKVYRNKNNTDSIEYKLAVGNVVITERTNAANNASTDENYLHKDHLGSPLTITDKTGKIIQQNAYDPWGKVHQLYLDNSAVGNNLLPTTRGYTGHEGIDGLDIIHMNGRIYDPVIGRFLQADPHIQAPKNSQSFNRYAYVVNNPLSYTDPSGFFFSGLKKFVKKYWRTIVAVAISIVTYGAASGWAAGWLTGTALAGSQVAIGAIAGGITGFVGGAVATGSLKGGLKGAISGAVFGAIGGAFKGSIYENGAFHVASHAAAGGVLADIQGGNFGHGFFNAGIMKGVGIANDAGEGASLGQITGRAMIQAMVGGTLSRVTGGKFANGAMTSAIQYIVNAQSGYISKKWGAFKSYVSKVWKATSFSVEQGPGAFIKIGTKEFNIEAGGKTTATGEISGDNKESLTITSTATLQMTASGTKMGYQFYKHQVQKTLDTSNGYDYTETKVLVSEGFKNVGQIGLDVDFNSVGLSGASFTPENTFQIDINAYIGGIKFSVDLNKL